MPFILAFNRRVSLKFQKALPSMVCSGYGVPMRMVGPGGMWMAAVLAAAFAAGAVAQSPGARSFESLLKAGFALHQQARYSESIPLLDQARALHPDDYFANLLLGIDLLRTGRLEDARLRLQTAARLRPGEEIPQGYLGETDAALHRYADAATHYRAAVAGSHASQSSLEAWAGFALERFHQISEQMRATAQGVEAVRRLEASASGRLTCKGAIPALEHALAAARTGKASTDAAYELSVCYALEAGKVEAQLRGGAQDVAAVHRLAGDVLLRLKRDGAAAAKEYQAALTLAPGDPALHERLGEALMTAGDEVGARTEAEAALVIDPHRAAALRTLAAVEMANRDYAAALPHLRQLAAESPGDRAVAVELGRALAQTGRSAEALALLAPALAAGYPDEKGALHALQARVLRQLGRDAEAEKSAAEARRLSDAFQASGNRTQQTRGDAVE
jgi:Flp pilus assembly protein TadD